MTENSCKLLLDQVENFSSAFDQAIAMQKQAASVGFDWTNIDGVIDKIREELDEVKQALAEQDHTEEAQREFGDLLFACMNLARHLNISPESALQGTNSKFYQRFNYVQQQVELNNKTFKDFSLQQLDEFWEQAKQLEQA